MRLAVALLAVLCGTVAAAEPAPSAVKVATSRRLLVTTLPPDDDDVTTPEPDEEQTVSSLSQTIFHNVHSVLDNPRYQWADAIVALLFGLVLVKDGEFVFKWLVVAAVGILGALLTLAEVSADLGSEYQHSVRWFIGVEVGLGCAYAAWKGLDGVMLTVFALLGMFLAYKTQAFLLLLSHDVTSGEHKWIAALWYSFFALFTMRIYYKRRHVGMLAAVAPLMGGALISSALSWMTTFAALHGAMDWLRTSKIVPQLQPAENGSWIEFLLLLLVPESKDVGVFANTQFTHPPWMHGKWCLDRVCGLALWFVLFAVGTVLQYRALKQQKIQESKQKRQGRQGSGKIAVQQMRKPKKTAYALEAKTCPGSLWQDDHNGSTSLRRPLMDDVEVAAAK